MALLENSDIGKLVLRVSVGTLMLSHGIAKMMHGIGGVKALTVNAGLPEYIAYGIFMGEVTAPLMIILGFYSRIGALILAFTMGSAIYLAHLNDIFILNKMGAPVIELPLLYLLLAISIFLLGPGKYSINRS